jgi:outer membrane receptor protein involved in Fe transport
MFDTSKVKSCAAAALIAVATLFGFSSATPAQTATGGIRGVVTDPTGATLPGATVTARNVATGVESKTTATGEGGYSIPRILPGRYKVVVEAPGFKKTEFPDIEVSAGKDTVIDAKLETGALTEVVTVTGGGEALVEKDTAQISATLQEKKISELPFTPGADGGLDTLALLAPGATMGFGNVNMNGAQVSVNGNRSRSTNFTIDGVDNNDLSIGGPVFFVRNTEMVSELQVVTNNFSAEYGRNQGGIVNYVSKSGGNEYHGAITYDRLDNKNFNSLTNLERRSGQKDPDQDFSNIFGYAVGGPVIKKKVFFFTTGFFQRNPGQTTFRSTSYAPTPEGIQALKQAFPNNAAIQYWADFSPFAMPLGAVSARPDIPTATIQVGGVTVPLAAPQRTVLQPDPLDEYTVRGDANLGDKHRLWGRFFRQRQPQSDAGASVAGFTVSGFTFDTPSFARQVGGGWTYTATSRLVNEFRFNSSRFFFVAGGGGSGGKGNVPHPDDIDKALTNLNLSSVTINGQPLLNIGPTTTFPQGRLVEAYQYTDVLNYTRGNHQLKGGIDFRKLDNAVPFLPNVNGAYVAGNAQQLVDNNFQSLNVAFGPANLAYDEFDQYYFFQDDWRIRPNLTLNLGVRYENTGQPINLLNDITTVREGDPQQAFWRQDIPIDARVAPRIPTDGNNLAPRLGFVYSPNYNSGLPGRLFGENKATIRGGYSIAYDAAFYNLLLNISTSAPTVFLTSAQNIGIPDAVPTGDKVRDLASRLGLISFRTQDPRLLNRTIPDPEFAAPYTQQWSLGVQRELFRNNVFEVRYVGNKGTKLFQTVNANPLIGNLVNGFSRDYIDSAINTPGVIAGGTFFFPGFPNLLPANAKPVACVDDPATAQNESVCNGRLFQAGAVRERINGVNSSYHALQMRYDGRFRSQWNYGVSYAYSHAIDNSSEVFSSNGGNSVAVSQNPLDVTRAERGDSGFDARHAFAANFLWELPFLREQKGFLGRVAGGWQVNGIVRVQSGRPFTPTHSLASRNPYEDAGFMQAFFGAGSHFRPFEGNPNAPRDRVAITDVDACIFYGFCGGTEVGGKTIPNFQRSPTGFYLLNDINNSPATNRKLTPVSPNDVRFIANGAGAALRFGTPFGNVGRNTFRGDRTENVDLSVFKDFRITERIQLRYRLQMLNAFNHPDFGVPNSIALDTAEALFYNFQENDGGRRTISMGLRLSF